MYIVHEVLILNKPWHPTHPCTDWDFAFQNIHHHQTILLEITSWSAKVDQVFNTQLSDTDSYKGKHIICMYVALYYMYKKHIICKTKSCKKNSQVNYLMA